MNALCTPVPPEALWNQLNRLTALFIFTAATLEEKNPGLETAGAMPETPSEV